MASSKNRSKSKTKIISKDQKVRKLGRIYLFGFLFVVLTWVEFRFFGFSESFNHGLFFFGLVNFNLILLLSLAFFIFQNIVRVFGREQRGLAGKSLKAKLIAAFIGFSILPTVLMFLVSFLYINNSFQKYFTPKILSALESAQEITADYIVSTKRRNYHFIHSISKDIKRARTRVEVKKILERERARFNLDALEFYESMDLPREVSFRAQRVIKNFPNVTDTFWKKAIAAGGNYSEVSHNKSGTLIRQIVFVPFNNKKSSALVLSSIIPLTVVSGQDAIAIAYNNVRNENSLAYPIKVIYIIILLLIALVIILFATWIGIYLAGQLSVPLERLSLAARKVAKGDYSYVKVPSGSPEITALVSDFNKMSADLQRSQVLLASAKRSEAWREVAKRIAHEIKNPLTPIQLSAERLQKKFGKEIQDEAFLQCTSMIVNQVDSLKGLVNEFSLFARLPKVELKMGNINNLIKEVIVLFDQRDLDAQIHFTADKNVPEFCFDFQQIHRAMTNLLDNSLAAKTENGIYIEIKTYMDGKRRVKICVEDNGVGVAPELCEKIFEPYVTTKKGGTGLGLAIVRRTFEEHHGQIYARCSKAGSLIFTAELPLILEEGRGLEVEDNEMESS